MFHRVYAAYITVLEPVIESLLCSTECCLMLKATICPQTEMSDDRAI